jgi:hypothetical protein
MQGGRAFFYERRWSGFLRTFATSALDAFAA